MIIELALEDIEELQSYRGGFNGVTLRFLNVNPFKQIKGWKERAIGMVCSEEEYIDVYNQRNSHLMDKNLDLKSKLKYIRPSLNLSYNDMFSSYGEYLNSESWRDLKWVFYEQVDKKCINCNSIEIVETHHKTYDGLGTTFFEIQSLVPLCRVCHNELHEIQNTQKISVEEASKLYLKENFKINYFKELEVESRNELLFSRLKNIGINIDFNKVDIKTLTSLYNQLTEQL